MKVLKKIIVNILFLFRWAAMWDLAMKPKIRKKAKAHTHMNYAKWKNETSKLNIDWFIHHCFHAPVYFECFFFAGYTQDAAGMKL